MGKGIATVLMPRFSGAAAAETDVGILETFFAQLAQGKTDEATDFLHDTNPWAAKNSDKVMNLKGELAKLSGLVGACRFHELIAGERTGSRYAYLIYLVGYDRQPLRPEIKVQEPSDQRSFRGVSFDAALTDDIEKQANGRLLQ